MFLAECGVDCGPIVMCCTLTGSSCCNVTNSCMSTAPAAPSLGASGAAQTPRDISGLIGTLSNLGIGITSAVTGRPVVTQTVNGQQISTLGNKPLVTGQVQASSVLFVGAIALVVVVLILANRS